MNPTAVTESDHCVGPNDAPLTLIEYGDYECPFCVKAFPVLEKIRERFGNEVRLVYRHVPRSRAQSFAKQAAEAAEFAASHGRFWEMHQALFSNPDWREAEQLVSAAKSIGLDPEACRKALTERTFAERVRDITVEAVRAGIIGTPTLFINGVRYEDRIEEVPLTRAIEAALAKR